MSMNIRALIEELEYFAEQYGDDVEVRLAQQPHWPFEYSIGQVIDAEEREEYDREEYDPEAENDSEDNDYAPVIYIGEGSQLGYLPGMAKDALGWTR